MRYDYQPPANWERNPEQTLKLAARRRARAHQVIAGTGVDKVARAIHIYRLDNPFMSESAWKILLNDATRSIAIRGHKRGGLHDK